MAAEFSDLNLQESILTAIKSAGYNQPTSVQMNAIPKILEGFDLLGIAQTGTGKLPLIYFR